MASVITTVALTTTAHAGICSWVDNVDIASSVKGSMLLSGSITLVTTGNPVVATVNGVVTGAVVGGSLLAVDGTCYVFDEYNVAENTSDFVNKGYDIASSATLNTYNTVANYFRKDA